MNDLTIACVIFIILNSQVVLCVSLDPSGRADVKACARTLESEQSEQVFLSMATKSY